MNREMLKEAIAEAKTIKETAIANAKAALEEAFTPQLTAMFAEKLNEMDEMEEEMETENYSMEEEGLEETFNLDEILAELDGLNEEDEKMEETEDKLEEDLMLEEMSDEEIEELILKVLRQEIESGNIEAGENFEEEETEVEDMEDMDDMGGEEETEEEESEEVELEELLAEILGEEEKVEETMFTDPATLELVNSIASFLKISPDGVMQMIAAIPAAIVGGAFAKTPIANAVKALKAKLGDKKTAEEAVDTKEMEETIAELRSELNEVNLLNAKLLYTNKIFKAKNLTESEKVKVLNTFDKAETVKEVKLVYETLTESLKASAKKNIKESLGSASRTVSAPVETKQPIIEVNDAFARMRLLAGLK